MFSDTSTLKLWFNESLELLKDSRLEAEKAANYAHGDQLGEEIKLVLNNRGQPEQWENNIAKVDNKISGFKQSRATEIKLFGRQKDDKTTAILLQDTIRAIHDTSDFDTVKESSDEDMRYAGFAVQELRVEKSDEVDEFGRNYRDIYVQNIPSNQSFLDPFSKDKDYKDARYFHQAFWTDKENLYIDFDKELVDALPESNHTEDTKLDETTYDTHNRKRVLVIYTWYKKYDAKTNTNKIYYCYWGGDTILKQEENPYKEYFDDFPITVRFLRSRKYSPQYAGMYKDILPIQDALNFAKLKIWHKLGNVKVLVEDGAVDDIVVFKDDYSVDDSVTEVNDINGIKEIKQHNDISQLLSIVVDSRNQMKELLGLSDEFLATASNRMGADALNQRINMGALGLSSFLKASAKLQENTLKKMLPLIQEFYDATRVMKIVDEDLGSKYFTINQPKQDANGFIEYEQDSDGTLVPSMDNKLNIGKYDLIYSEMEKPLTSSSERYRQDVELMKLLGQVAPQYVPLLLPEILADSHTSVAEKIRFIIESQQNQESQDPMGDINKQFEMRKMQLDLAEQESRIGLNHAKSVHTADKNNIEMERIMQREIDSKRSTGTRNDQMILNAMMQGGK
jgi:hypothetical protein